MTALGVTADNFAASIVITDLGPNTLVAIDVSGAGTIIGSITPMGVNGVGTNAMAQQDFLLAGERA